MQISTLIKKQLTKEIPALVADVYEEVVEAFNQYIPVKDGNFYSWYP
jgi:hypothetical protein